MLRGLSEYLHSLGDGEMFIKFSHHSITVKLGLHTNHIGVRYPQPIWTVPTHNRVVIG